MKGLGIEYVVEIARYMQSLFKAESRRADEVPMPKWELHVLEDCRYAVKVIIQALQNQRHTSWSVTDYTAYLQKVGPRCTGQNTKMEDFIMKSFPPGPNELVSSPCVVGDKDGRILLWYLPGIVSPRRQELILTSLKTIEERLKVSPGSKSWRVNQEYFRSASDCVYKPGTVSLSLAWFQQAMASKLDMEVAAELRLPAGQIWVQEMAETCAILGGILSIICPPQFEAGLRCIELHRTYPDRIAKSDQLGQLLEIWSSPYTACSVINNRDSPLHRDNGGGYTMMDLLTTVGNYSNGRFSAPGLGLQFWYRPGTVIALAGRIVRHGATAEGERLCFAQYLRENVLKTLQVPEPGWAYIHDIWSPSVPNCT